MHLCCIGFIYFLHLCKNLLFKRHVIFRQLQHLLLMHKGFLNLEFRLSFKCSIKHLLGNGSDTSSSPFISKSNPLLLWEHSVSPSFPVVLLPDGWSLMRMMNWKSLCVSPQQLIRLLGTQPKYLNTNCKIDKRPPPLFLPESNAIWNLFLNAFISASSLSLVKEAAWLLKSFTFAVFWISFEKDFLRFGVLRFDGLPIKSLTSITDYDYEHYEYYFKEKLYLLIAPTKQTILLFWRFAFSFWRHVDAEYISSAYW